MAFSNSPWKPPPLVKYSQRLPDTWKTIATMQWDAFSVTESRVQECLSLLVLWQAIFPPWPCGLKEAVSMSARRSIRWKFPNLSLQSTTSELENVNKSESLCLIIHSFFIRLVIWQSLPQARQSSERSKGSLPEVEKKNCVVCVDG